VKANLRTGFTLIEVMIALALAALLATVSWTLVVA
jgi:prepilin-type N-terminal cleavage/methylation domain-containing protein